MAIIKEIPILLTASVSTHGMKGADFSDDEREAMYLTSLEFYIRVLPETQHLVFAENSGWNLEEFKMKLYQRIGKCASQIEFLSVNPSIFDLSRGKGYNEVLLINEALTLSKAIRDAQSFLKVTGRYPIYNLPYFLSQAKYFLARGGKFYGDMKDHKIFDILIPWNTKKWNGHAVYTVLFATTIEFYKQYLFDSYINCNDYTDNWIENVWFRILNPFRHLNDPYIKLRFSCEPICGGLQGSSAKTIAFSKSNTSFKAKCARFVGNTIRVLMPWVWF